MGGTLQKFSVNLKKNVQNIVPKKCRYINSLSQLLIFSICREHPSEDTKEEEDEDHLAAFEKQRKIHEENKKERQNERKSKDAVF